MDKTQELLNKFPHFYDKSINSANYKILDIHMKELESLYGAVDEYYKNLNPEKAKGVYLDRMADIIGLERQARENDEDFRKRVLSFSDVKTYETTFASIKNLLLSIISKKDLFYFSEGVGVDSSRILQGDWELPDKVFNGKFSKGATKKEFYKNAGNIYICINKRISYQKQIQISEILKDAVADGVKINLDFKFEHAGNYYDEVVISKWKEPALAQVGNKEIEKQGVN